MRGRTATLETIERARAGERDAMEEIWRIYQPQLLRFLRAKRAPMVDDVASEVWISAARGLPQFEGDGRDLQRWLFTIANRRSVDEQRRVARRRDALDDGLSDRWKHVHCDEIDEFDGLERAIGLLRQLPQKSAAAVLLRVVHGLSMADVGAILECSPGNARVLVHRGLNRLRELVAEDLGLVEQPMRRPIPSPGLQIAAASPPVSEG